MKSGLTSFVGITLFISGLLAQDKTKPPVVSKGEYSTLSRNTRGEAKTTRIDRWHMESLQDGSFSVDVELATTIEGLKAEEHHLLTKELKPKRFASVMSSGVGTDGQSLKIECDYGITELSCHTTDNGSSGAAKLLQKPPYIFWPTVEVPTFDFPWAFQALGSQAERVVGHKTAMPLITLDDSETEKGMRLKVQEIEQVEYLGRETVNVLGQKLLAHKFRLADPKNADATQQFWVSESGILLCMTIGEGGSMRITLTQYEGPPLDR